MSGKIDGYQKEHNVEDMRGVSFQDFLQFLLELLMNSLFKKTNTKDDPSTAEQAPSPTGGPGNSNPAPSGEGSLKESPNNEPKEEYTNPFNHVPEAEKKDLLNFMTVKAYEDDVKKPQEEQDPQIKFAYDMLTQEPDKSGYNPTYEPKFSGTPEEVQSLNERFGIENKLQEKAGENPQPEVTKPEPTKAQEISPPPPQAQAADVNTKDSVAAQQQLQVTSAAARQQSQSNNKIALSGPNDTPARPSMPEPSANKGPRPA